MFIVYHCGYDGNGVARVVFQTSHPTFIQARNEAVLWSKDDGCFGVVVSNHGVRIGCY